MRPWVRGRVGGAGSRRGNARHDDDHGLGAVENIQDGPNRDGFRRLRPGRQLELGAFHDDLDLSVPVAGDLSNYADFLCSRAQLLARIADPAQPGPEGDDAEQPGNDADRDFMFGGQRGQAVDDDRRQSEKGEKRGQDIGSRKAHTRQMLVRGNDHMVAEDAGVEEAAAEPGDKGESEPTKKYEQISKSPGH